MSQVRRAVQAQQGPMKVDAMDVLAIPILVYHRVHADNDSTMPKVVPGQYCGHVTASQFRQQMNYLVEQGFHAVTHDRIAGWLLQGEQLPPEPVAINFDDNRYNVLENAFPIMRACGFVGTMFVITGLAIGKEIWKNDFPALVWDDLAKLVEAGWFIGSHTQTHVTFGSPAHSPRDEAHIIDEIVGAQEVIRQKLGVPADHFAYPMGTFDEASERCVKRYYKTARLWQKERHQPPAPPYEYVTERTDPYRLVGINISAKLNFDEFRVVVEGASRG